MKDGDESTNGYLSKYWIKAKQRRRKLYKNPELFQGFLNVEDFDSFLFKFSKFPKPSLSKHSNGALFYNRLRWYD